jgi:hypothetical protein
MKVITYGYIFDRINGYTCLVKRSRFVVHILGKIRRFYIVHFRKDYLHAQLRMRKGRCNRCGLCCSLAFTCPMLTLEGRCCIYNLGRWKACEAFPIDRRDIEDVFISGGECGFRFDGDRSAGD